VSRVDEARLGEAHGERRGSRFVNAEGGPDSPTSDRGRSLPPSSRRLIEKHIVAAARAAGFSPRELDVARLVIQGLGNREIGLRLRVSPLTVKNLLSRTYAKAQVSNRMELAAYLVGLSRAEDL
jgi:DNA-binding NarL/FixJ family response regulator